MKRLSCAKSIRSLRENLRGPQSPGGWEFGMSRPAIEGSWRPGVVSGVTESHSHRLWLQSTLLLDSKAHAESQSQRIGEVNNGCEPETRIHRRGAGRANLPPARRRGGHALSLRP